MTPKRTTRSTPAATTATTATTSVTNAQLKAMIDQGVTAALAARDADRSMNGDDSHNSGMGVRKNERAARECTYPYFMKCQPLNFKGMEGVVKLTQWFEKMKTVFSISNCSMENQIKFSTCTVLGSSLTWWNSHVRTVGHDVAYVMTWADLKKKMTDKYCRLPLIYVMFNLHFITCCSNSRRIKKEIRRSLERETRKRKWLNYLQKWKCLQMNQHPLLPWRRVFIVKTKRLACL
ncbi:hypothetical protein Tco_0921237 [Tanacetum coccineum]